VSARHFAHRHSYGSFSLPHSERGWGVSMRACLDKLWLEDGGQDIAEYAVMLAVILVLVVGTIQLVGGNANNVFSNVASSIAQ